MRKKINTTISVELKRKVALEAAVINREDLNKRLGESSWDDLISYITYIIKNRIDLQ